MEDELLSVVNKIENYNNTLEQLRSMYGEDINEIIKALLYKYCIMSYDRASEKNRILNRVGFFLNFEYYGLFDEFNLDKDNIKTGLKPVKYISLQDIERRIKVDYPTEYGRCYKHNFLNIIEYLHLILIVIKKYKDRINNALVIDSDNEVLEEYHQFDYVQFNNLFEKIQGYRDEIVLEVIMALSIDVKSKRHIVELIKSANGYRLTEEDRLTLCKYIGDEDANEIVDTMYAYQQVDTKKVRNSKVIQLV
jgi:hypothetical protein